MDTPSPAPAPAPSFLGQNLTWIIAGALLLTVLAIVTLRPDSNTPPAGAMADYSWPVSDLNGKSVNLADFKGQVVFLNIWATWCPPCVGEMPSIDRLAANPALQGKPITVMAISVGEDLATVQSFVERRGLKSVKVLTTSAPPPNVFATDGIPATFLIAPDGKIVKSHIGGRDWDGPEVVSALEELAATAPQ